MELCTLLVNIILIYLISYQEDFVSIAYVNDFFNILLGQHLPSRVSRIDNDDALQVYVLRFSKLNLFLDILDIQGPILFLI